MKNQEKNTHFVDFFLKRLKSALNFNTDTELAAFLEVSDQTLSNWKARNSVKYDIVFTKSVKENVNLHWLFTGQGEMFISGISTLNNNSDMNCNECPYKRLFDKMEKDSDWYQAEIDRLNQKLDALQAPEMPQSKQKCA